MRRQERQQPKLRCRQCHALPIRLPSPRFEPIADGGRRFTEHAQLGPARDDLVNLVEQNKLDLGSMVSRRIKLDEINDAFRAMQAGEVIRSVIV